MKHVSDKPGGRSDPQRLTKRQRQRGKDRQRVCYSAPSGVSLFLVRIKDEAGKKKKKGK